MNNRSPWAGIFTREREPRFAVEGSWEPMACPSEAVWLDDWRESVLGFPSQYWDTYPLIPVVVHREFRPWYRRIFE